MTGAAGDTSNTVIGIHDGHNASVAVVRDGRVEFALQEERITRIKNQGDAPRNALEGALALVGGADRAPIALNGHYMNYGQWQRETIAADYGRSSRFAGRVKQPFKDTFLDRAYQRRKAASREERLSESGVSRERIATVEHHLAHASAAYYTCPWPTERTLVLTCDGSGDRLSATVSLGNHGELTRIAQISEHDSIGRLYAMVTRHLGMAPLEHEYKVMGLAPYVSDASKTAAAAEGFRQLFEFTREPLVWRRRRGVPSMYSAGAFLDRLLAGQRFDLIAAGIQRFIEDWLATWVRNCIRETGIRRVACSGGVFMNVKANLRLLEIPELEDLYIFPSCGDESNSIGAALRVAAQMGQPNRCPLGPIYYGDPITDSEADRALDAAGGPGGLRAVHINDIERKTAEALAAGKIVARAKGAMEFGARALGNRSILARADSPTAVRIINQMIKSRDFWMPFAPSVLAERAGEYYSKPKPVASPFMMFAFPSRPEKRPALAAAQHPYDFTTRPQEVTAAHNADYHRLLKEYEARTGEGILLNTSFNLHGEPMVYAATPSGKVDELTSILIESASAVEDPVAPKDISPLESQRLWERQAEQNLLARLEKGGLLAPPGPVEEVLNTVVGNLIASSKLDIEVHCRVLLTTPFETFTMGHIIVISRGLIDVLPDEGSLAMTLASSPTSYWDTPRRPSSRSTTRPC